LTLVLQVAISFRKAKPPIRASVPILSLPEIICLGFFTWLKRQYKFFKINVARIIFCANDSNAAVGAD
jgi:hypothetical protein